MEKNEETEQNGVKNYTIIKNNDKNITESDICEIKNRQQNYPHSKL